MMKKIIACLLSCVLFVSLASFGTTKASAASIVDKAREYEWGHTYSGITNTSTHIYYRISIDEKSLVNIAVSSGNCYGLNLYSANGTSEVISMRDFYCTENKSTGVTTYTTNRVLDEGTYYLEYESRYANNNSWSVMMTREPALSLRKAKTESVKSTSSGKLTVTASTKDSDITGFEIQYATKSDFSDAKTVETDDDTAVISGLVKNKKYYVRSRAYAIYGNGMYVYSAWSTVKSKKVN